MVVARLLGDTDEAGGGDGAAAGAAGSFAHRPAGIVPGDRITHVNGTRVRTVSSFALSPSLSLS